MFQERDLKKAERRLKEECADRAHSDKEQKARQEKTAHLQKEIKRLRRTVHTLQRHMLVSISTPGYLTQYRLNVTLLHWNAHNICINVSHTSLFLLIRSGLEGSLSHAEEEHCVLGEVECVEKTLRKRRAELREADRLLLEAEMELKDTRAKVWPSVGESHYSLHYIF